MRMADRCGERVRRVCRGPLLHAENQLHHVLHLLLVGAATTDDGLLDLSGAVLVDRHVGFERCANRGRARLTELERAVGILVQEHALDRDLVGPELTHKAP